MGNKQFACQFIYNFAEKSRTDNINPITQCKCNRFWGKVYIHFFGKTIPLRMVLMSHNASRVNTITL
jgi:hypothetical protein